MFSDEEKEKLKSNFKAALKEFAKELQSYVSSEDGQWSVKGFIDIFKNVYTITADTKIVSKVLEIHLFPKLLAFAEGQNLGVVIAEKQNWYPDFSLVGKKNERIKFAVDLKTTYRSTEYLGHVNGFTLGSHGAYFIDRTGKKNIQFPYREYLGHFCLGVIYTRTVSEDLAGMEVYSVDELGSRPEAAALPTRPLEGVVQEESKAAKKFELKLRKVEQLQSITSVVKDFQFFVCEKWEIASDSQGSGNTANIGGITFIDDILAGNGVFAKLGEAGFDEYWTNYGQLHVMKNGKSVPLSRLEDYLAFRRMDPSLANKVRSKKKQPS
jgi:Restriction endonuclease EcoRV